MSTTEDSLETRDIMEDCIQIVRGLGVFAFAFMLDAFLYMVNQEKNENPSLEDVCRFYVAMHEIYTEKYEEPMTPDNTNKHQKRDSQKRDHQKKKPQQKKR